MLSRSTFRKTLWKESTRKYNFRVLSDGRWPQLRATEDPPLLVAKRGLKMLRGTASGSRKAAHSGCHLPAPGRRATGYTPGKCPSSSFSSFGHTRVSAERTTVSTRLLQSGGSAGDTAPSPGTEAAAKPPVPAAGMVQRGGGPAPSCGVCAPTARRSRRGTGKDP